MKEWLEEKLTIHTQLFRLGGNQKKGLENLPGW